MTAGIVTVPYDVSVPFFVRIRNVTGMIKCIKLGDISYILPRKFITEVLYVLRGSLLYSLNRNIRLTEVCSTGHDNAWNPQKISKDMCFTLLDGYFCRRNIC